MAFFQVYLDEAEEFQIFLGIPKTCLALLIFRPRPVLNLSDKNTARIKRMKKKF